MREFVRLEAGMECSMLPVWVVDADTFMVVWANDHALELWGAESREELFNRQLLAGAPAAVHARVEQLVARARAGEVMTEEWIMYPRGNKTPIMRQVSPVRMPDARLGLLYQARRLEQVDEDLERDIAMFRHSVVIAALVAPDARVVAQNPTARGAFGLCERWTQWFDDPAEAEALLASGAADEGAETLAQVRLASGELRWHIVMLETIRDPVSAELTSLVEHLDVTDRVEAERLASSRAQQLATLNAALATVERQRQEIMILSAPLLEVGRELLAVPITGRLDIERAATLRDKLCAHVHARGVEQVILDLTGMAELDEHAAHTIERLVKSLGLLGVRTVLSGLRPAFARELARTNTEPEVHGFYRSLAAALEACQGRS